MPYTSFQNDHSTPCQVIPHGRFIEAQQRRRGAAAELTRCGSGPTGNTTLVQPIAECDTVCDESAAMIPRGAELHKILPG